MCHGSCPDGTVANPETRVPRDGGTGTVRDYGLLPPAREGRNSEGRRLHRVRAPGSHSPENGRTTPTRTPDLRLGTRSALSSCDLSRRLGGRRLDTCDAHTTTSTCAGDSGGRGDGHRTPDREWLTLDTRLGGDSRPVRCDPSLHKAHERDFGRGPTEDPIPMGPGGIDHTADTLESTTKGPAGTPGPPPTPGPDRTRDRWTDHEAQHGNRHGSETEWTTEAERTDVGTTGLVIFLI